ncbi:MAG TPA: M20 family metallopeptidase, partial [Anaerolineae bacterium]
LPYAHDPPKARTVRLIEKMINKLKPYLIDQVPMMTDLLSKLVSIESQTEDIAGVNRVGDAIRHELTGLGAEIRVIPQAQTGHHLLGVLHAGGGSPITLILHMDTVHPAGTLALRPIRRDGNKLYGPGIYDMKASHVIALYALKVLNAVLPDLAREIRVLFTSDEETGSKSSRQLIEDTAKGSTLVMVMEPALPDGNLKSARKGVGDFKVTATGRASHAGAEHQKGINAIEELAHQVLRLQACTDYARGVTFSVGSITGGNATNVVPDNASLIVDTRANMVADAEWITKTIHALKPVLPGASLTVDGEFNRYPMECDAERLLIYNRVSTIAKSIGMTIGHGASGGGSDASFTAAMGIPTMDGFGAIGDGAHAVHEHILVDSLVERTALCAAVIAEY